MAKRLSKRKSSRRKSFRRKSFKKNTMRRKTMRRKTTRGKTMKGGIIGMQCGKEWRNRIEEYDNPNYTLYNHILKAKNNNLGTNTYYTIQLRIEIEIISGNIIEVIEIPNMKLKDIKTLKKRILKGPTLNRKLKVQEVPAFKEFFRGDRNNCTERFNDIERFFNHIIKKIELDVATAWLYTEKIIKILGHRGMKKLTKNFKPHFESLDGAAFLDEVKVKNSKGRVKLVQEASLKGDWIG